MAPSAASSSSFSSGFSYPPQPASTSTRARTTASSDSELPESMLPSAIAPPTGPRQPSLLAQDDVLERGGGTAVELAPLMDEKGGLDGSGWVDGSLHRRAAGNGSGFDDNASGDTLAPLTSSSKSTSQRRLQPSRAYSKGGPRVFGSSSGEKDAGQVDGGEGEAKGWLSKIILSGRDRRSFLLLILLYTLQGVPIGLTFGTLPFLLKPKLSYSQLALLSLSTYPYSLKLLWSPIVDSWFSAKLGRRKSWIVPVQAIMGCAMFWLGGRINGWLEQDVPSVAFLTFIFVSLIFFAATQDIAVDGWALTLLSQRNLSYASTAQTIGLNLGYFMSFTVFLAFNSVEFGNKYFRTAPLETPLVTLGGYLRNWSFVYFIVTLWLYFKQDEDPVAEDEPEMDVKKVYKVMWSIIKLKHVQKFILLHFIAKIGFMANDSVTSLKLLEKGLLKEDMAVAVLIDFPFQIIGGWLAASWSTGPRPLTPWMTAYTVRLGFGLLAIALVAGFPSQTPIPYAYFLLVIGFTVLGSFTSTVQFVGISAFHTQISDPVIGGTYMTLLNTVSNLGGTWPKPFVLKGVDYFTQATCHVKHDALDLFVRSAECSSDHGRRQCADLGGECVVGRDGYYVVSILCVITGALLLVGYIQPTVRKLQSLPPSAWKVTIPQ